MRDAGGSGLRGLSPERALPVRRSTRGERERSSGRAGSSGSRRSASIRKIVPDSKPTPTRRRPSFRSAGAAKKGRVEGKGRGDEPDAPPGVGGDETGLVPAVLNAKASQKRLREAIETHVVDDSLENTDARLETSCVPPDKCTGCGKENVVFWDDLDGVFVCHSCEQWMDISGSGEAVVMAGHDDLVDDRPYDPRGAYYGTTSVLADDTGASVAMNTITSPAARRAIQRGRSYDAKIPLRKFVQEYGDHLRLRPAVVDEAFEYALRIHSKLPSRSMPLHRMALSGVYAAIRMNMLPLTLVDLVAIIPKGDLSVYAIGRSYRTCLSRLELQVPVMDPAKLVPKLFEMLLGQYEEELDGPARAAVLRDAKRLIGFISGTEVRAQHPTVLAATSIYLAMEMNMLAMPRVSDAARAFRVGETALKTKANNIRHAMAAIAGYLVYGENITAKNAMKYARVLIKLSSLKSRAEASWGQEAQADARDAVKAAIRRAMADDGLGGDGGGGGNGGGGSDDSNGGEGVDDEDDDLEDLDVDEYLF